MDPDEAMFVAAGVAGYAIGIELLIVLAEREIIDDDEFQAVLDRALANVENLSINGEHPLARLARFLIWSNMEGN
jgi:hypothetical protein